MFKHYFPNFTGLALSCLSQGHFNENIMSLLFLLKDVWFYLPWVLADRLAGNAGPRNCLLQPGPSGAAGVWQQAVCRQDMEGQQQEETQEQSIPAGLAHSPESVAHHPAMSGSHFAEGQTHCVSFLGRWDIFKNPLSTTTAVNPRVLVWEQRRNV